jgi:hypothetical protein
VSILLVADETEALEEVEHVPIPDEVLDDKAMELNVPIRVVICEEAVLVRFHCRDLFPNDGTWLTRLMAEVGPDVGSDCGMVELRLT